MPNDAGNYVITKADEINHKGSVLFSKGEYEAARYHFLAALSIEPNNPTFLLNLGACLRIFHHYEAAYSVAKRSVLVSQGQNPFAKQNFGVSQLSLRQYNDALITLKQVVEEQPQAWNYHNYGLALYIVGKQKEAIEAFDKAMALLPNPQIASDRSLAILALGNLQEGLAAYEARWQILHKTDIWQMGVPEWQGEPLQGKRILLHHEQGFGDGIMLARFAEELSKRCDVTLAVPQELIRLFEQSFNKIKVVDWKGEVLEQATSFDYHSPLLSTMRWLGFTNPDQIDAGRYLISTPRTTMKLPGAKFRIGLCWASGNHGPAFMERRRVVPLTQFLPITEIPGVSLVALQKGNEQNDIVRHGMEGLIYDVSHRIEDFADTAEVISYLDLVVSVDSAVAHLAGALGKPCIMLSPYTRCWRWWSNRSGWPWYKDMMQFHQSQDGTWNVAVQKATSAVRGAMNR